MHKNICDVKDIKCWGAHIGIKTNRRDLAMIYSENEATGAAVFTQNLIKAAPVQISEDHIKCGKIQAIVVVSGNANACTGEQGLEGAKAMVNATADMLNIEKDLVFIACTGIIGQTFPTAKVVKGIRNNIMKLSDRPVAGTFAANAILTTDTFAKEGFLNFQIDDKEINMGGIAKGSGMIHPDMATMLGFIACDIAIKQELLDKALKEAVNNTFNMITVDGDTSTNDTVAIMCNGRAGNTLITEEDRNYLKFRNKLEEMCMFLAKLIVSDGEGATKIIEYKVRGAKTNQDARQILRTISNSNLVKTAIFGQDPNWGRIIAAAGRSGVNFDVNKMDLFIGKNRDVQILKDSQPLDFSTTALKKNMRMTDICITLDLKQGKGNAIGWGSDLSYDYVRINAEYTT
ncbi:bifunctional glutamate N-acetyltransferase/amino-acid acetyltransferase ArgJ [bacterium]|nr:bifunctional glutamate N-acetyltransferase/amino-acid acetyltransferase ArgJ [bacterium]